MQEYENRSTQSGVVYWITGLSGAGKTTIGTLFYNHLKKRSINTVHLDGDKLRQLLTIKNDYHLKDRQLLANKYSKLCKMLSDQSINVVCTTISMFNEVFEWNRKNIKRYIEIYIKAPLEVLIKQDQKGIYDKALKKEMKNVMGIDLKFEEPQNPDILLFNDGRRSQDDLVEQLIKDIEQFKGIKQA